MPEGNPNRQLGGAGRTPTGDFAFDVARGAISGVSAVIKFGRNPVFEAAEDLWDLGGTFVAPTQARIHNIVSTDAGDDGDPVGLGAQTIRVFGLVDWNTPEVSEDITLNGVTDVPTVNAYVIIHRMVVLTHGATNINIGVISATAVTDATVTAQIAIGLGQTQMAIYGIPAGQTGYMTQFQGSIGVTTGAANVAFQLLVNSTPDAELLRFKQLHRFSLRGGGASAHSHGFYPYLEISGPALVKIQVTSDTAATDADGGFDMILK